MVRIKRILCPIDFSDFSRDALEYAQALARWHDAKITVLHTYAEQNILVIAATMPPPINRGALQQHLDNFTKSVVAADVAVENRLQEGHSVSQILDVAASLPADLIVMGTHGRGGFDRLTLGSVTEKVLRKTTCPVLTVTIPPDPDAPAGTRDLFKRILCPIDYSEASSKALLHAMSIAKEARAKLSLVHIVEGPPDPERDMAADETPEYLKKLDQDEQARLRPLVPDEIRQLCDVKELVRFGKPYVKILHLAQQQRADLIVMGAHGGLISEMLFGSTTSHVVRTAGCPVLTVPVA